MKRLLLFLAIFIAVPLYAMEGGEPTAASKQKREEAEKAFTTLESKVDQALQTLKDNYGSLAALINIADNWTDDFGKTTVIRTSKEISEYLKKYLKSTSRAKEINNYTTNADILFKALDAFRTELKRVFAPASIKNSIEIQSNTIRPINISVEDLKKQLQKPYADFVTAFNKYKQNTSKSAQEIEQLFFKRLSIEINEFGQLINKLRDLISRYLSVYVTTIENIMSTAQFTELPQEQKKTTAGILSPEQLQQKQDEILTELGFGNVDSFTKNMQKMITQIRDLAKQVGDAQTIDKLNEVSQLENTLPGYLFFTKTLNNIKNIAAVKEETNKGLPYVVTDKGQLNTFKNNLNTAIDTFIAQTKDAVTNANRALTTFKQVVSDKQQQLQTKLSQGAALEKQFFDYLSELQTKRKKEYLTYDIQGLKTTLSTVKSALGHLQTDPSAQFKIALMYSGIPTDGIAILALNKNLENEYVKVQTKNFNEQIAVIENRLAELEKQTGTVPEIIAVPTAPAIEKEVEKPTPGWEELPFPEGLPAEEKGTPISEEEITWEETPVLTPTKPSILDIPVEELEPLAPWGKEVTITPAERSLLDLPVEEGTPTDLILNAFRAKNSPKAIELINTYITDPQSSQSKRLLNALAILASSRADIPVIQALIKKGVKPHQPQELINALKQRANAADKKGDSEMATIYASIGRIIAENR